MKALWERCPTPEMRELLWEIDRLHRLLDDIILTLSRLVAIHERANKTDHSVPLSVNPMLSALKREPAYAIAQFRRKRQAYVQAKTGLQGPEPEPPP